MPLLVVPQSEREFPESMEVYVCRRGGSICDLELSPNRSNDQTGNKPNSQRSRHPESMLFREIQAYKMLLTSDRQIVSDTSIYFRILSFLILIKSLYKATPSCGIQAN